MLSWMENHSVYIHIPFCLKRCLYCDFNTYAGMEDSIPAYVDAICHEIELVGSTISEPISVPTIYFGGGTPSLLPVRFIEKIFSKLMDYFNILKTVEITIEANPGTVDLDYLENVRHFGINRLSLGVQSALPAELILLGRIHTVDDVLEAFSNARRAGFDNISMDFIYGLPNQTVSDWNKTLEFAVKVNPEHLSLYALTLDEITPMAKLIASGRLPQPDEDVAADQYEMAMDQLENAGYTQYEISNWAKTRSGELISCSHNLQYWHNRSYLGFGAGAHGYSTRYRTANVLAVPEYIWRISEGKNDTFPFSPANETRLEIDYRNEIQEAMMVGLRLTIEGVARSHFFNTYNLDFYKIYKEAIDKMVDFELLEWVNVESDALRLTRRGRLLGNQVFMQFVGE